MIDFEDQNRILVDEEIKLIVDDEKIIEAFRKVPRHLFVEEKYKNEAYSDSTIPIGFSQTTSQPSLIALMIDLLKPARKKVILEIGTGCGYQTALLSKLVKQVYSVERIEALANLAKKKLQEFNIANAEIKVGDGSVGWKEKSPFDGIIVSAGAPSMPTDLVKQLKDGGRIVIPIGKESGAMLVLGTKVKESLVTKEIEPVSFVPLLGKFGWYCG